MSLENLNHSEELINPDDAPRPNEDPADQHLMGDIEIVSDDEVLKLDMLEENADESFEKGADKKNASHKKGAEPAASLTVNISTSLHRKLLQKAASEGVDVSDLATELLAEGLVLRAWEIMERKTTMRGGNSFNQPPARGQNRQNFRGQGNSNSGNGYQNNSNSQQNHNHGRGRNYQNASNSNGGNSRRMNYNQIMDDSANFLEYVRSQEKKQK